MISREKALQLLKENGFDPTLLTHSLETEAVMKHLAQRLGEDALLWRLTGLLHDLDYPKTKDNPEQHGLLAGEQLKELLPQEAIWAIIRHNSEHNGHQPQTKLDYGLRCAETVTGLVHANALVRPRKMEGMKAKSLKKKMKDKSFAANVKRERIKECDQLGLELGDFFALAITAISEIFPTLPS